MDGLEYRDGREWLSRVSLRRAPSRIPGEDTRGETIEHGLDRRRQTSQIDGLAPEIERCWGGGRGARKKNAVGVHLRVRRRHPIRPAIEQVIQEARR